MLWYFVQFTYLLLLLLPQIWRVQSILHVLYILCFGNFSLVLHLIWRLIHHKYTNIYIATIYRSCILHFACRMDWIKRSIVKLIILNSYRWSQESDGEDFFRDSFVYVCEAVKILLNSSVCFNNSYQYHFNRRTLNVSVLVSLVKRQRCGASFLWKIFLNVQSLYIHIYIYSE